MKPVKVMSSVALAAVIFSVGAQSVWAAPDGGEYNSKGSITFETSTDPTDPVDPTDPTDPVEPVDPPEPGTPGPLSIDFASSFYFGTQKITSVDETYNATAQKVIKGGVEVEVPNYVQVTDNRGGEKGWSLSVKQEDEFTSTTDSANTLEGSKIVISNIEAVTASESSPPSDVESSIILDGEGATENVMAAKAGEGAGTHLARFGDADTKATSVSLEVPGSIVKYAETYETALVWTLTDVPAN